MIRTIVVTGGPCSGKTTGIAKISEWLREYGYKVLVIPETATELMKSGYDQRDPSISVRDFQCNVLRRQLDSERLFRSIAEEYPKDAKVVVICDRGALDGAVYVPNQGMFQEIIADFGISRAKILSRYDNVIHLQSAAVGAEAYYTTENNIARMEVSIEAAREVEARTIKAYLDHPHLRVIDNKGQDFDAKMQRFKRAVAHALGIPEPHEIERKFLVDRTRLSLPIPVDHAVAKIEQHYLEDSTLGEVRVRRTTLTDGCIYTMTRKTSVSPGIRIEHEHRLTESEYRETLRAYKGQKTRQVHKRRISFLWHNQYFELDLFSLPDNGMSQLEIELTDLQDEVLLPPWIPIIREVTDDKAYTNARLAVAI